ncbi:uncharacterized protein cubi_02417 [Cryptosporidium ubiquitum]|uniref:Uncharacterized protein n=1 Tax=Cryptosporidium ubiquitum TaxID=857276 RepID=A0A1J4MG47_9CRYT|nr:uncharacterized protein cubi_02417 [Cryptosporidium ubiquitum]OII73185.1 hypothetical protein cubi_02417 [Cryptosporidium ubiquitum]
MSHIKPVIKLKGIEQIWKNSTDILSFEETSIIQKSLKHMSNEIKELKECKQSLSNSEVLDIYKRFGDLINCFATHFDFNRVKILSQRRSIAKYSYHILICIINIIEDRSIQLDKESLIKSCQICLNYYFPSKAIKTIESNSCKTEFGLNGTIEKTDSKRSLDFYNTPPRNSHTTDISNFFPNPSPFNLSLKSPLSSQNPNYYQSVTRYSSSENCLSDYSNLQIQYNQEESFNCESEFFPSEFQFPMPIEEAKRRLREKLLRKEMSEIKKLKSLESNQQTEYSNLNSPLKNKSLVHSWGTEQSDKSDLHIEDLVAPSINRHKNSKIFSFGQNLQFQADLWESTKVAAQLAETLPEPYRTRRIRREIYQQSIERSVELLKSLEICNNFRPGVLTKTMIHTIERIIDY